MIGYNIGQINELIAEVGNSFNGIGKYITSNWPALSSTMQKEWVGPDEVSCEDEFGKVVKHVYTQTKENIQVICDNIKEIGNSWMEFQRNNILEGADAGSFAGTHIEPVVLQADELSCVKRPALEFGTGTNLGLTNGAASKSKVDSAIKTFYDTVYSSVKGLFDKMDSSKAFLGEQSKSIDKYIQSMGEAIAKLNTCYKNIISQLDIAMDNYNKQQQAEAQSAQKAASKNIDFKGENLK